MSDETNPTPATRPDAAPDDRGAGHETTILKAGAVPAAAKKTTRARLIWEYTESLLIAVGIALLLRWLVVEPFKIPTGSMEPTLHGDARTGDRILVSKYAYRFGPPKRWDVVVFKYPRDTIRCRNCGRLYPDTTLEGNGPRRAGEECPDCHSRDTVIDRWSQSRYPPGLIEKAEKAAGLPGRRQNYIKRLVGLPGETISIRGGNIIVNGRIERKPSDVQDSLWVNVFSLGEFERRRRADEKEGRQAGDAARRAPPGSAAFEQGAEMAERLAAGALRLGQVWNTSPTGWKYRDGVVHVDGTGPASFEYASAIRVPSYPDMAREAVAGELLLELDITPVTAGILEIRLGADDRLYRARIPVAPEGASDLVTSLLNREETVKQASFTLAVGRNHRVAFSDEDAMVRLRVDDRVIFEHSVEKEFDSRPVSRSLAGFSTENLAARFQGIRLARDIYHAELALENYMGRGKDTLVVPEGHYVMLGDNSRTSSDSRVWGFVPRRFILGKAFCVFFPFPRVRVIH
ncbi:MAG: signal peptidase I [Planctomycetota bacterium]